MSKHGVLFETEEMTHDECVAAVNFSAGHIQVAVVKMAAFVIGYLDDAPELVEAARRVNREMDHLCALLKAERPQPWNFVEEGDIIM